MTNCKDGDDVSPALGMRIVVVSCIADVPSCAVVDHPPRFGPKIPWSSCSQDRPFPSAPSCPFEFTLCSGRLGLVPNQAGFLFGRHAHPDMLIGTAAVLENVADPGLCSARGQLHRLVSFRPDHHKASHLSQIYLSR